MTTQTLQAVGVTATIATVTPEMARLWIDTCMRNRKITKAHVDRLAADMRDGRWVLNGEPVQFDREGRLINGQHRLSAIVLSGVTVQMLVVTGVEPRAQDTIDIGAARSIGNILQLHGYPSAIELGALASADYRYSNAPGIVWANTNMPSKATMLVNVERNSEQYQSALRAAKRASENINAHRIPYALLHVLAHRSGHDLAWGGFEDRLFSGVGLEEGDARLTFRNHLIRRPRSHGSWSQQHSLAIGIKAFNAYLQGKPIKLLRFYRDELPMPRISQET